MAKRRTRKEKEKVKYPFLATWGEPDKNASSEILVKRQFKTKKKGKPGKRRGQKKAKMLDKQSGLSLVKHNIIKSLVLASLILGLEMVLYLFWHN